MDPVAAVVEDMPRTAGDDLSAAVERCDMGSLSRAPASNTNSLLERASCAVW